MTQEGDFWQSNEISLVGLHSQLQVFEILDELTFLNSGGTELFIGRGSAYGTLGHKDKGKEKEKGFHVRK